MSDAFFQLIYGAASQSPSVSLPDFTEGVIRSVGETTATVILDGFSQDLFFGPMPFTRSATPPQVGDRCVVLFLRGSAEDRGWIIGWQLTS